MNFYNIKLRLLGALHHEVIRQRVSAPEVLLLNAIHGGGAIADLAECGVMEFSQRQHRTERRRLEIVYGQDGQKQKHLDMITQLFGSVAATLPEFVTREDLTPVAVESGDAEDPFETVVLKGADETAAPKPAANAIKPETIEAKDAVKDSIRKLGGTVPSGNVSIGKLREILAEAQIKANNLPRETEPEPPAEPVVDVMSE